MVAAEPAEVSVQNYSVASYFVPRSYPRLPSLDCQRAVDTGEKTYENQKFGGGISLEHCFYGDCSFFPVKG
jgi:hypothetical protein